MIIHLSFILLLKFKYIMNLIFYLYFTYLFLIFEIDFKLLLIFNLGQMMFESLFGSSLECLQILCFICHHYLLLKIINLFIYSLYFSFIMFKNHLIFSLKTFLKFKIIK